MIRSSLLRGYKLQRFSSAFFSFNGHMHETERITLLTLQLVPAPVLSTSWRQNRKHLCLFAGNQSAPEPINRCQRLGGLCLASPADTRWEVSHTWCLASKRGPVPQLGLLSFCPSDPAARRINLKNARLGRQCRLLKHPRVRQASQDMSRQDITRSSMVSIMIRHLASRQAPL